MKIELFRWLEGPEELEIGPYIGSLWITEEAVEVDVEDADLEERLLDLLDLPLTGVGATPSGGTALRPVEPGQHGYLSALVERLARKDYRLHATPAPGNHIPG